ncbi:MAG TPA: lytic murein transglycosylase [Solirubrobacteraceae bacterium]|jgi:membrane-bound lytic murein transglycosylase B|nr:lytic murein transglycosylase [Solirubrobacteraceae bacterium]
MSGIDDAPSKRLGPLKVRRVILSALAGGGLTAVGLSGPLSGGALAAEPPSGGAPPTGTTTTPAPSEPTQTQTSTTGTTPETTTTSTGTSTTTTPVNPPPSTPTQTTTPTSTTQAPRPTVKEPQPGPKVLVQHTQETTDAEAAATAPSTTATATTPATPSGPSNVAAAPQLAAAQSEALAAMLAGSSASIRALDFYRIPLYLLPIYQAAAVQYGVPWPVLAAINEVETDFGTDLSVSTAGAVGWMQFMPETWLQYGVDAVNAGYADPYNPVDAIFAAARYLHAAGASSNLRAAILAYNHSEAYVESVLLRARLFASYPPSVIATLTGLTEGSLPVVGAKLSPTSIIPKGALAPTPTGASSATAGATPLASEATGASAKAAAALPGSTPAPSPTASAADAERALNAAAPPSQLSELLARRGAPVVAVEDGRIVGIGRSHKLGRYVVLRDTYGDLFTYAGLGSIAPDYRLPKPVQVQLPKGALQSGESAGDPTPKLTASSGRQLPVTLHVAKKKTAISTKIASVASSGSAGEAQAPVEAGKVRVFAHPDNPDAAAAARLLAARSAGAKAAADGLMKLGRGSVVAQGTVLGHLDSKVENPDASLRFAIRPAGAQSAIDPRPILENWSQLGIALHPQGAKDGPVLAGATASDAFLLSRVELDSAVLADPDIKLGRCDREQVVAGKVGSQALALLVFLSRSGLKPTVGELRCGSTERTVKGVVTTFPPPDTIYLTAINGVPVAGHQGAGTITDITIRTLLTLQHKFAPKRIVSLMRYPGAPSTVAASDYSGYIKIELAKPASAKTSKNVGAKTAHAASSSATVPLVANPILNTLEWQRLMTQLSTLQKPKLSRKPSASAIRDKSATPGNGGSGTSARP